MALNFRTRDKKVADDWWEWEVFLDENEANLHKIREVEYVLHPTFPDRVRLERDPNDRFRMKSEGWGEFDIIANVRYVDGTEVSQIVPLKLKSK